MPENLSLTKQLVHFSTKLTIDSIPDEYRRKIALHLIDSIGCGMCGVNDATFLKSAKLARMQYSKGKSITLDNNNGLSAAGAAFLNAMAMNALDYDDCFEVEGRGMGHPGATLVAGALAAVGQARIRGADLLTALVAAWEINGRIIMSQQPSAERFSQVYGVCQHESVGAAVAYGLLKNCDAEGIENSIGLAATLTPLPSLHKYNWQQRPLVSYKDYNAPAAEAGVRAVEMHLSGIVGPFDIFDGEQGFWRMMGSDQFSSELLVGDLMKNWQLRHASFKMYPVCRWMHTALESLEKLLISLKSSHSIRRVRIYGSDVLANFFLDGHPISNTDAQFSLKFAAACMMLDIPRHKWSCTETLNAQEVIKLSDIVDIVSDNVFSDMWRQYRRPAARAEIETVNEIITGEQIYYPAGCNENPVAEKFIIEKALRNFKTRMSSSRAEKTVNALLNLESCSDVGSILVEAFSD